MPGRTYTAEFKLDALGLAQRNGVPKAAESLGISDNILYRWRKEASQDKAEAFRGKGVMREADAEVARLRRELANLKEEKEILKKALAIFSQKK